ncbi:hypothetical protein SUGI_0876790 [Cryptomeria japonica]|uniref:probable strigolactone esterase DAD2 n=1 Tax=Cryptomeria japonica TaxID=3369 RepID=UPI0024146C1F|nr:probable strigolactone esterase DAD2 [Cryptomeria japonica]GLJ42344.1 hypothetical protein SUGI_0876790 [Cryptomeria japonica]
MSYIRGSELLKALNVRVVGSGDKISVLSHGFGTDQSVWQRILPYFITDFKVVLFDLMCAGSVNPEYFDMRKYSCLDAYVDDLLDILDELKIDKCVYVGHSVSAMIGCLASIRRPALFQRMVLLGASPRYLNDIGYEGGFRKEDTDQLFLAMESNYSAWVSGFAPLAVGADVPAAVREFSRTLFNMRPDIALWVARTVFESDMRGILGHVKVPCYVIQSNKDMAVPLSVADCLKTHLGGKTWVKILQTEGHLPQLSAPALVIQALKTALSS